ncbi:MAG: manganese efflux pump MntP family protein, partial [Turicibacter sp.]
MGEYILFIIVMAVALAMDAFAVAITLGMDGAARTIKARVKVASSFGVCQGILFLGGCISLHFVSGRLTTYNHYIAGGILIVLGIRMLRECVQEYEDTCPNPVCQQKKCKQVK